MNINVDTTKSVVKFVVARSVGFTVSSILSHYAPAETKIQKIEVAVGSHVVGQMVANQTATYVDGTIDDAINAIAALKSTLKTLKNQ